MGERFVVWLIGNSYAFGRLVVVVVWWHLSFGTLGGLGAATSGRDGRKTAVDEYC